MLNKNESLTRYVLEETMKRGFNEPKVSNIRYLKNGNAYADVSFSVEEDGDKTTKTYEREIFFWKEGRWTAPLFCI